MDTYPLSWTGTVKWLSFHRVIWISKSLLPFLIFLLWPFFLRKKKHIYILFLGAFVFLVNLCSWIKCKISIVVGYSDGTKLSKRQGDIQISYYQVNVQLNLFNVLYTWELFKQSLLTEIYHHKPVVHFRIWQEIMKNMYLFACRNYLSQIIFQLANELHV